MIRQRPALHATLKTKRLVLPSAICLALRVGGTAAMLSMSPIAQSQSSFGAVVELSNLDGSNGFTINGIDASDYSGRSVSGAGDINGDGVDDLIIGAFGAGPDGNAYAGESYVVFGGGDVGRTGNIELSELDGSDGFVINGIDADDLSGRSVSSAGDINGDGMDDLIIGAYGIGLYTADPDNNDAGESYVVFGGRIVGNTGTVELSDLDGSNGFVINGVDPYDSSGRSVSGAGDINGDGVDDLIVGASNANPNDNSLAGESYVVFGGRAAGNTGTVELSDLDGSDGFVINGIDTYDTSGISVSEAGDINGDGVDDLIIGASGGDPNGNEDAGESYVLFGGSAVGNTGTVELSDLDGSNGFVINGIDTYDQSGGAVSSAGDINDDGVDDLIIGTYGTGPDDDGAGESYVLFGGDLVGNTGSVELAELDGSDGFVINGVNPIDFSGSAVSGAGDINGDGADDLIIGSYGADPNGNDSAGESYVLFGGSVVGSTGTIELADLNGSNGFAISGIDANDFSGSSVSGAGDINGDGVDDLIIGAFGADSYAGESYVLFGQAPVTTPQCDGKLVTIVVQRGESSFRFQICSTR